MNDISLDKMLPVGQTHQIEEGGVIVKVTRQEKHINVNRIALSGHPEIGYTVEFRGDPSDMMIMFDACFKAMKKIISK
jgi:hypothetical protein